MIHCAGIIEEGLLIDKSWEKFNEVLSPKVQGTLCLDEATQAESLECFVLFSSTSARLGLAQASDYASANGFLDGFASWRAQRVEWDKDKVRRFRSIGRIGQRGACKRMR